MPEAFAADATSLSPSTERSRSTARAPRGSHQAPQPQQLGNRSVKTVGAEAGPSVQRMGRVYATTAEAIANFRPTPREVINGFAPHVFDERKRRRSQQRSRSPKPYWHPHSREKRSSPLRGATIISWDERSIYLEQSDTKRADSTDKLRSMSESTTSVHMVRDIEPSPGKSAAAQRTAAKQQAAKLDKSGWKYFRVDIRSLKSVVDKLKLPASQNPSPKS